LTIKPPLSEKGSGEAPVEIETTTDGEVNLNARYLAEALNDFSGEKINFGFNSKNTPVLLTDPADDSYKHIVMPIKG
jgi:DNA polymerase III sliding clamp (beta) subunit (PCNA family)